MSSPEVVIPPGMMVEVPQRLHTQFPKGFIPGLGYGLNCAQSQPDGSLILHTLTGRGPMLFGPMVPEGAGLAPSTVFILPEFTPAIATLKFSGNRAELLGMLPLKDEDGNPLHGLPPPPAVLGGQAQVPLDMSFKRLEYDKNGIDPQGVAYDPKHGAFWVADGYRPSLARITPRGGRMLAMFSPGNGLEDYLATARAGWGFSGVGISPGGRVYTIMRGVLFNEGKPAIFSRIIELDSDTERVRQLPYPVEEDIFPDTAAVSMDDVVALADKRLLVLEQGVDKEGRPRSLVFAVDLTQTHNINRVFNDAGQPLEVLRDKALWRKQNLNLPRKTLVLDLHAAGFPERFAQSMTLLSDGKTLAVMGGHGFGVQGEISGYATGANGAPVLNLREYRLGGDGNLTYGGQPSKAGIGLCSSREIPRLWVAVLPKKALEY